MRPVARIAAHSLVVLAVTLILANFSAQAADNTPRTRAAQSAGFAYWSSDASGRPMNFPAPSSPDNWLGGTGNWSNGAEWSAGLPGSSSDVFIGTGNDLVNLDVHNISINSLTLGGSSGRSTLQDPNQGGSFISVSIAGALTINQPGNLMLYNGDSISAGATSSNAGGITLNGASMSITGNFTNTGGIQLIEGGRPATINISGSLTNGGNINDVSAVESLTIGGSLTNSGGLAIAGLSVGGAINNTGSLDLIELPEPRGGPIASGNAASLTNSGTIDVGNTFAVNGNATNSGQIMVTAIGFSASLGVGGTLTNTSTGQITALDDSGVYATNLANSGRLQIGSFGALNINDNVTNSGTISANGNSSIVNVNGRFTNNAGASLGLGTNASASITNLINAGSVTVGSGSTLTVPPGPTAPKSALQGFLNSGTVDIASGGTIASQAQYTQTAGQTTIDGHFNGTVNLAGGSLYGDNGTIAGSVTSNASFNIGDAPMTVGEMSIMGNYTQRPNGSLTFDIASLTQYDQLNVSGHAQLNGLMTVNLLNGYIPQLGNMFDIMNFASESGTFSTVVGLPINNQEHFTLEYNATNLTLDVVSGPGMQVSSGRGTSSGSEPFITPLGDNMSFVSSADYSQPASSVPEPGSILLFGSGVAGVAGFLRRDRLLRRTGDLRQ